MAISIRRGPIRPHIRYRLEASTFEEGYLAISKLRPEFEKMRLHFSAARDGDMYPTWEILVTAVGRDLLEVLVDDNYLGDVNVKLTRKW